MSNNSEFDCQKNKIDSYQITESEQKMYCKVTVDLIVNSEDKDEAVILVERILTALKCLTIDGDDPEILDFSVLHVIEEVDDQIS